MSTESKVVSWITAAAGVALIVGGYVAGHAPEPELSTGRNDVRVELGRFAEPGRYSICGANLCDSSGEILNAPPLVPPCNVFQFDVGASTTAYTAKAGECVLGKSRAFVLERDWMGRSKMVSLGLAANVAVTRVDVSPDGQHVTFRAGRSEGVHSWRIYRADPHGGGSYAITPDSADGSHDVEPVWSIDCSSGWVHYVEFDQVELRDRYVPIAGGGVLDASPAGVSWPPCAAPPLIFRDGFESGTTGAWS